jgi:hypothetical protein
VVFQVLETAENRTGKIPAVLGGLDREQVNKYMHDSRQGEGLKS